MFVTYIQATSTYIHRQPNTATLYRDNSSLILIITGLCCYSLGDAKQALVKKQEEIARMREEITRMEQEIVDLGDTHLYVVMILMNWFLIQRHSRLLSLLGQ